MGTAGVSYGRGRKDLFYWCGFVFVALTPRWCCVAAVGQRPPIEAGGSSLYGHSRQQRAAGAEIRGRARPRTMVTGLGCGMQREHGPAVWPWDQLPSEVAAQARGRHQCRIKL